LLPWTRLFLKISLSKQGVCLLATCHADYDQANKLALLFDLVFGSTEYSRWQKNWKMYSCTMWLWFWNRPIWSGQVIEHRFFIFIRPLISSCVFCLIISLQNPCILGWWLVTTITYPGQFVFLSLPDFRYNQVLTVYFGVFFPTYCRHGN